MPSFPGAHRPNRRASDEIASVRLLGAFGGQALDIVNTTAFFDTHFSRLGVRDDLRNGLMTAA